MLTIDQAEEKLKASGFSVIHHHNVGNPWEKIKGKPSPVAVLIVKGRRIENRFLGTQVHGLGREKVRGYAMAAAECKVEAWLAFYEVETGELLMKEAEKAFSSCVPCKCSQCKARNYDACNQEPGGMLYWPIGTLKNFERSADHLVRQNDQVQLSLF